jgi:RHS repeat-associated protein
MFRFSDLSQGITNATNYVGHVTTITREAGTNFVTEVLDHLGRKTVFAYDVNKNVSAITRYKDPPPANPPYQQPVTWTYTYDTAANHYNLLTSMMTPPIGNPPAPRTWTYGLDPTGKTVTSITDPLTHQTTMTYNSFGQPTQITDALSHATFFDYDATTGFLTGVRDHSRELVTDPRGAKTRFTYDQLNRVTAIADPLGGAVRFQYDANSNLTKVIDPRGGETAYVYNNMNQLASRTDPLGRAETYAHDLAGNRNQVVDRKNQRTEWDPYDDLNRPTVVRFYNAAGGLVSTFTYGYDAANRVQTLTDSLAGTITPGYDVLDRLISETTAQGTVSYGLDDADRRASMTVAGQPQVVYQWDHANRLTQITRGSLVVTYGHDNADRRTSLTFPNSVRIDYSYDDANRLTRLDYSGLVGGPQSLTYAYDGASNRIVTGGSWARTLLPDPVASASYDAANRQLTFGTKTMIYDNNGNLETLTDGGQITTYTWDVRNLLASITGPGLTASLSYDAGGRRTQKTVSGFTTSFLYDGSDVVRAVAGGSEVNYLRGLRVDETLARIEGSGTSCYLDDPLRSTVALTTSGGTVASEYSYEPFGRTTATGAPTQNAFQFTGRENDGTGLYYFRARYYEPRLGRFIQEDPIGPAGGLNAYAYAGGNPVSRTDRFGLKPDDAECCRAVERIMVTKYRTFASGTVGCCPGGRKVACVFYEPGWLESSLVGGSIIRKCLVQHEEAHLPDAVAYGKCPSCGRIDPVYIPYSDVRYGSECKAWGVQEECLRSSIAECGWNRVCRWWVERNRRFVERGRDDYCIAASTH